MRLAEGLRCQWTTQIPALEVLPNQNQVVFAGDSITLKCRAPSITDDEGTKLKWLWNPNISANTQDFNMHLNPNDSLSNIKIEYRRLENSGLVDR